MVTLDELQKLNFKTQQRATLLEVQLTPIHIEKLLEINTNNIPPVKTKINLYADYMINGRWMYNGDSIRVSKSGVLLDGQNRLMAAQKAKMNLVCDLIVGLEDEVFNTIDQGRTRQKGHLVARDLGSITTTDAQTLTTAVTRVIKYQESLSQLTTGGFEGKIAYKFTAPRVIEYVNQHPELLDQLEVIKKEFGVRCNLSRATLLYVYHIGSRYDASYTLKFLRKAVLAIGLTGDETLYFYHQCLNEYKAKQSNWTKAEFEHTLIKVWSKVADKGLKAITKKTQIKAKKDEEFIKFIAPTEQALIEMSNAI
ncbi:hypothetical protein [Photobacterium leiognathi]|uniref:hypothetical protein n=1 Tax=Photobacterium leiognathi TaxID=553611 RepID=UPI00298154E3|nr:hypothetical protein [Photobacterium leiognathi]